MASPTISERSTQLRTSRVPFVHARVVLAERPTSAKPGDEALILSDGTLEGFVGGSCAESTVREHSLASLASGDSCLVRITPEPEDEQDGKIVVHNPCLSGGTLEIFLEPAVPAPLVLVWGSSPITDAMLRLGAALGYDLRRLEGELPDDAAAVVVAAHGRGDEETVLTTALRAGIDYVGLVASPRRGAAVVAALDVDAQDRARVSTPAGLDIGARTAPEIALSILAEILERRPRPRGATPASAGDVAADAPSGQPLPMATPATAIDPVCGMSVEMVPSSIQLEHDGTTVWFCAPGCKRAFAADPSAYGA